MTTEARPVVLMVDPAKPKAARAKKAAKATSRKRVPPKKPQAKPAKGHDANSLLESLRAAWQQSHEAHRLRVEGQFRVAAGAFKAGRPAKAKDLDKVRAALKVRIKPRKGRAKDLRRVEEALDQVLARAGIE